MEFSPKEALLGIKHASYGVKDTVHTLILLDCKKIDNGGGNGLYGEEAAVM